MACCAAMLSAAFSLAGCDLAEDYVPEELTPTVSTPTIGEDGVLRVGVNTDNPPLAGGSTQIVGIDVDIAAAIADELGLRLETVEVGSSPLNALEQGTVDIVMGIDESNTDAAMWKSEAYIPTAIALFAASADAGVPSADSGATFAAQVSSASSWSVTNEFGAASLTTSPDLDSAFELLASGEVDYVATDAVVGVYAANSGGLEVSLVALLEQPRGYVIGVLESNAALQQVIADALYAVQEGGIVSVIESKWLGAPLTLDDVPLTTGASSDSDATAQDSEEGDAESDAA